MKCVVTGGARGIGRAVCAAFVAEGADVRHVVTRSKVAAQGIEMTKMDVVSLRRTPQGWRVQLKGDMTGMAELMKRRLQGDGGKGAD